jgi:hypothetical protein
LQRVIIYIDRPATPDAVAELLFADGLLFAEFAAAFIVWVPVAGGSHLLIIVFFLVFFECTAAIFD